jgi:predicted ArsR family transcriptional regulator
MRFVSVISAPWFVLVQWRDLKCTVCTVQNASMHDADRHAVLADPTRRALLDALREGAEPLGVADLARAVGLHPNSVREQMRRLEVAGLVRVSRAAPSGRGRPGLRFVLAPGSEDPYRVLAGVIADQVAAQPDAAATWEAAGERWGRGAASAVAATAGSTSAATAGATSAVAAAVDATSAATADAAPDRIDVVVALLADAGFAPEPVAPGDDAINLRSCPFLPIEHRHLPVVCGIHLGFIRGALRELGSTRDATSIEPLIRPGLCVARLGSVPSA